MSFEIIDNFFQVIVIGLMALISGIMALRESSKEYLMLSCGYFCMSLATLYYVLCLIITGKVPQVFYVSEISWIAAYLFYLSVSLFRTNVQEKSCIPATAGAVFVTVMSILLKIMGPSPVTEIAFAVTAGTIVYRSIWGLCQKDSAKLLDVLFLLVVSLQISLYGVSSFIKDYTNFNLYFAIDIMLTLAMAALLPALKREVETE